MSAKNNRLSTCWACGAIMSFMFLCYCASGQEITVVAPPELEELEGRYRGTGPNNATRVQYLYDSSFFESLEGYHDILSLAWRPDMTTNQVRVHTDSITVRLSTTDAEKLSLNFAENVGTDVTTVLDGPLTVSTFADSSPRSFDFRVDFTTPFLYDPRQGNLLVEFATPGFDVGGWWVDNEEFDAQDHLLIQAWRGPSAATADTADAGWNALAAMEFTFAAITLGDFDRDGLHDVDDVDLLATTILRQEYHPFFDINSDGLMNQDDRIMWVTEVKNSWFGDANLDGMFDSDDLIEVFSQGKYGTGEAAGWAEGDFDGDLDFDADDLLHALAGGGYDIGARKVTAAVPEATSLTLLGVGLFLSVNAGRIFRKIDRTCI